MYSYDNDLPQLGVIWREFASLQKAQHYAKWAENVTKHKAHPCETEIEFRDGEYIVKVRNW
jgi:hypothetical protein